MKRGLRRYLLTDGEARDAVMPDWYPLMRAARYLGVAPWDLIEHPIAWQTWAIIADGAESEAEQARIEQAKQANK